MNTNTNPVLANPVLVSTPAPKQRGRSLGSSAMAVMTITELLATGKVNANDPIPVGRKFLTSRGVATPVTYAKAVYAALNPALSTVAAPATGTPAAATPTVQVAEIDLDAPQS